MIKMVVADLDGTLLKSDLSISNQTIEAINQLRDKGIIFTIATGRPEQLVKEVVDNLNIDIPVIMYNGSVVGHPFQEERLFEKGLDQKTVKEIITYCEQEQITYMPYHRDMILSHPNSRLSFYQKRNQKLPKKQRAVFKDITSVEAIEKYIFHKILLIEYDHKRYDEITEKMQTYDGISVVASNVGFIDINPLGVSKGDGLKRLADYFNVSLDDIVVFGDQDNDVSILAAAGIGVAMENASKKAKKAADEITDSNDEDGVARWIIQHILKK
ncbi:MAG: Cof-type HAD-IIB family hydrolase [Candidatus Izemoplasma sp.]|nr:Cof-type HAD-IIB family hydrolase [Candidatus Izemoplasma sp.]